MLTTGIKSNHFLCFWDSAECGRIDVESSFARIGQLKLVPPFDNFFALENTARDIYTILGQLEGSSYFGQSNPIHTSSMGSKDFVGVSCAQKQKGRTRNDYPFIFSLKYDGTSVEILDQCGEFEAKAANWERRCSRNLMVSANELFAAQQAVLPTKDLTAAIVAYIYEKKGVMLKSSGALYFLDESCRQEFEHLATSIERSNPEVIFTTATSDLAVDKRLGTRVCDALSAEIVLETGRMQAELDEFASSDKKMRVNGVTTRLGECSAWLDKISHYESIFGTTLDQLREAVEKARATVGVHGLKALARKKEADLPC